MPRRSIGNVSLKLSGILLGRLLALRDLVLGLLLTALLLVAPLGLNVLLVFVLVGLLLVALVLLDLRLLRILSLVLGTRLALVLAIGLLLTLVASLALLGRLLASLTSLLLWTSFLPSRAASSLVLVPLGLIRRPLPWLTAQSLTLQEHRGVPAQQGRTLASLLTCPVRAPSLVMPSPNPNTTYCLPLPTRPRVL